MPDRSAFASALARALASLAIVCLGITHAVGGILDLQINQADFLQGADTQLNSDWGEASLTFTGTAGFQFFNLMVDGSWQIRDVPVLSLEGAAVSQTMAFNFNLGNPAGNNVSSVNMFASLSLAPLGAAPSDAPLAVAVGDVSVTVGGLGGGIGPVGSAAPLIGKLPVDFAFHGGMINQDVGVDECAPGAFSNSLRWLDDRHASITIPESLKSVADLKTILMWSAPQTDAAGNPIPGTGGVGITSWMKKRDALGSFVTTKFFGTGNADGTTFIGNDPLIIQKIIKELKHGEDVEIWGAGHAAVLTCLIEHLDGTATLCITHDTDQGSAGGTKTQVATFNPITGQFTSAAYGFPVGSGIRGFVSESVPEPSSLLLVGLGVLLAAFTRRRKRVPGRILGRDDEAASNPPRKPPSRLQSVRRCRSPAPCG